VVVLNWKLEPVTEISLPGAITSAFAKVAEAAKIAAPRARTLNGLFIVLLDSASSEVPVVAAT
jgi:hypothetical protein